MNLNNNNLLLPKLSWTVFIFYFVLIPHTFAQSDLDSSNISQDRLWIIGGTTVGLMAASYGFQDNVWWKGEKGKFHFNWSQDWNANLGADKFGHFYFSYLASNIYIQAYEWAGITDYKSRIYGGLTAMLHQTFTEVRDGFSKQYGFSFGDYAFNLLGAFYPLLQYEFPLLNSVKFKISYYSSSRFKMGSNDYIIDDYESTYNWMSIDINDLLPVNLDNYFPDLVDFTIGYSVKGLDNNPYHEIFIGLDWDLEALPGNSGLLKFLKKNLNYYHLPSPVIKIYPNVVWYGLKF